MKNGTPKPVGEAWIIHIGYSSIAVLDHASAKTIMAALTKARVVEHDHATDLFFKPTSYHNKIAFETIAADRLRLDREKPDYEPAKPSAPPAKLSAPPANSC
jgi:hypothetical protein